MNKAAEKIDLPEHDLNKIGLTISTFIEDPISTGFAGIRKDSNSTSNAFPEISEESNASSNSFAEISEDSNASSGSFTGMRKDANSSSNSIVNSVEQSRVHELEEQLRVLQQRNIILEERGKKLAQELDIFRHRRLVYWSDRFRNKFDAWHLMHPGFEEAKDDTMLFQGNLKGFRLLPSLNLVRLSSLKYELELGRPGLCAILLAPIIDMPSMVGEICVRITDSKQIVLREVSVPIARITEEEPCELQFPSLKDISTNRLSVHIFAQGVDVPIRIFELRKYPKFGFAKLQRKLFAGYRFKDE